MCFKFLNKYIMAKNKYSDDEQVELTDEQIAARKEAEERFLNAPDHEAQATKEKPRHEQPKTQE
jgi:hypothetical protein